MVLSLYKQKAFSHNRSHPIYRTIATTPATKARPPNPAPTTAAPPVEAAGLAELEALLVAEEAELLADLVAVLMELAPLETTLDTAPVAELCLLDATEEAEEAAELMAEEADEIADAAELEALATTEAAEDAAEVTASEALTAWAEMGVLMLTLAVVVAEAVDAPALGLSAALKLSLEIPNWVEYWYCPVPSTINSIP